MKTTPSVFTPTHKEEVVINNEKQSVHKLLLKKILLNNNWLLDLKPIGSVIFININQFGVKIPDASIWQECNGSEIVNPNSPLRTIGIIKNYVPDLRDRYLKVSPNNSNGVGGSQDHSLQHSHATGPASSIGGGLDDKSDRRRRVNHGHQIATQYEEVTTLTSPAFYKFVAYMKVV